MQHIRVFSTEPTQTPEITPMTQWAGWYDPNHPENIPDIAQQQAVYVCDQLQALPQGKRVVFLRGILRYESYIQYGADLMYLFENGGVKLSRQIGMLRPFGRELRRRGMYLDGVWTDNEGGMGGWGMTQQQFQAIFSSPKARAKMPPGVRNLRPEMFIWGHPNFRNAMIAFNAYAQTLMGRSLQGVMVGSGVFALPTTPGGPNIQPPTMNFNISAPTWPVYDPNGWPLFSYMLDGKSSSPGLYLGNGGRYAQPPRVHDWRWNSMIDCINHARSAMHRPNAKVWPVVTWPNYSSAWVWEQMVAHFVRTGINWTSGGCGFVYWTDPPVMNALVEDPLVAQILNRHDQAFAVQRNLPEIPMDSDSFTTAGFTTTYSSFLANVPPP